MSATVKAVEGDGEVWELDILGVPYGGPADRDADGEWFDAATEMHPDRFGLPPLVHYHGYGDDKRPAGEPEYVGKTVRRWVDAAGVWFRAVLDKGSARARALWDAAKLGTVRASSGSIDHLVRKDPDGHIREWPVAELSILDTATGKLPANSYAVAMPVAKALYERAGLEWPDADPEAEPEASDPAGAQAAKADHERQVAEARARAFKFLVE